MIGSSGVEKLQRTPNLILKRLSSAEQIALSSAVAIVRCEPNAVILDVDQKIDALYFPENEVMRLRCSSNPDGADVGMVGREGMFGWSTLLGLDRSTTRVTAGPNDGTLIKIDRAAIDDLDGRFRNILLRFIQIAFVQLARQIEIMSAGTLDRRIACWLLMRHDRAPGDALHLHHAEIAETLGVRRASITDAFHRLEGDRLIRCQRGKLLVRDRPALEAFAGGGYGQAEALYRRLIGPFGKTALALPAAPPGHPPDHRPDGGRKPAHFETAP